MSAVFCRATSKSTGVGCQQPERWLMGSPDRRPFGAGGAGDEQRVCQIHGRQLERQGWVFLRELHPVPGFAERAAPSFQLRDDLALLERSEPDVERVVVAEWTRGTP